MQKLLSFYFSIFLFTGFPFLGKGQSNLGHSPISRYGIGILPGYGLTRNESMGGTGLSNPSQDHPNLVNPALLSFNEKVNLNFDLRYYYRSLTVDNRYSYKTGNGGPSLVSISIPVHKRLSMAAGISPYSLRDFNYSSSLRVGSDSLGVSTHGTGGTSKVFLAAGYKIHRQLRLGLEAGYIFGTLTDSVQFGILPENANYTFIDLQKRKIGQFIFRPGIQLNFPVPGNEGLFFSGGASAELGRKLSYRKYSTFSIKGAGAGTDTLDYESRAKLERPLAFGIGFGVYKPLNWSLSAEVERISTSGLQSEGFDFEYQDGMTYRLGFEISPGTKRSTRYLNIITFRTGLFYQQMPYVIGGKQVTDQRVSMGASFPIVRKEAKFSRPLINFSVAYGRRGLDGTYLGTEDYWQIQLSFTLNDFLWFNRYRIN